RRSQRRKSVAGLFSSRDKQRAFATYSPTQPTTMWDGFSVSLCTVHSQHRCAPTTELYGRPGIKCSIPAGGRAGDPLRHVFPWLIAELMLSDGEDWLSLVSAATHWISPDVSCHSPLWSSAGLGASLMRSSVLASARMAARSLSRKSCDVERNKQCELQTNLEPSCIRLSSRQVSSTVYSMSTRQWRFLELYSTRTPYQYSHVKTLLLGDVAWNSENAIQSS
ncbi:hypothetical protein FQN60_014833, partial [Etheostoma spectabile]